MVKLNNLKTIKTLDKVKKFEFGSVVECMDTNLPDLPVTLTKPLGKRKKEQEKQRDRLFYVNQFNGSVIMWLTIGGFLHDIELEGLELLEKSS